MSRSWKESTIWKSRESCPEALVFGGLLESRRCGRITPWAQPGRGWAGLLVTEGYCPSKGRHSVVDRVMMPRDILPLIPGIVTVTLHGKRGLVDAIALSIWRWGAPTTLFVTLFFVLLPGWEGTQACPSLFLQHKEVWKGQEMCLPGGRHRPWEEGKQFLLLIWGHQVLRPFSDFWAQAFEGLCGSWRLPYFPLLFSIFQMFNIVAKLLS